MADKIQIEVADDGGSTNKLVIAVNALADSMDKASTAEDKAARSVSKAGDAARSAATDTGILSKALGSVQSSFTALGGASVSFVDGLTASATQAKALGSAVQTVAPAVTAASSSLDGFGGISKSRAADTEAFNKSVLDLNAQLSAVDKAAAPAAASVGTVGTAATKTDAAATGLFGRIRAGVGGIRDWAASLNTAGVEAENTGAKASNSGGLIERGLNNIVSRSIRLVAQLALSFATFKTVAIVDGVNAANDSLKLFMKNGDELTRIQSQLQKSSIETGIDAGTLAQAYNLARANTEALGQSSEGLVNQITAITAASQLYGATTAESAAGVLAYFGAFKNGRVDVDALQGVMEKFPGIGAAVNTALGGTKVGIADLGRTTAATNSILNAGGQTIISLGAAVNAVIPQINAESARMGVSVKQAFDVLVQSFSAAATNSANAGGLVTYLSGAIIALSNNIGIVVGALALFAGALAVIGLAGFVSAVGTLATLLGGLIATVTAAVGTFLTFAGIVTATGTALTIIASLVLAGVAAFAAGAAALVYYRDSIDQATASMPALNAVLNLLIDGIKLFGQVLYEGVTTIISWGKALLDLLGIGARVTSFLDSLKTGFTGAANQTDALKISQENLTRILGGLGSATVKNIAFQKDANTNLGAYIDKAKAATAATGSMDDSLLAFNRSVNAMSNGVSQLGDSLDAATRRFGLFDAAMVQATANGPQISQLDLQRQALDGVADSYDRIATSAGRAATSATGYANASVRQVVNDSLGSTQQLGQFSSSANSYVEFIYNNKSYGSLSNALANAFPVQAANALQQAAAFANAKNDNEARAILQNIRASLGSLFRAPTEGGGQFATGGSFVVGGAAGTDANLVQFKATRGEEVTIAKPDQVRKGNPLNDNGGSIARNVTVQFRYSGDDYDQFRRNKKQITQDLFSKIVKAVG